MASIWLLAESWLNQELESKAVSYAIVGAGGFLGVDRHDVAIPVNQFTQKDGKFVLAGATKDAIKAIPQFEYAPR